MNNAKTTKSFFIAGISLGMSLGIATESYGVKELKKSNQQNKKHLAPSKLIAKKNHSVLLQYVVAHEYHYGYFGDKRFDPLTSSNKLEYLQLPISMGKLVDVSKHCSNKTTIHNFHKLAYTLFCAINEGVFKIGNPGHVRLANICLQSIKQNLVVDKEDAYNVLNFFISLEQKGYKIKNKELMQETKEFLEKKFPKWED